jgi:hypothetical protein
MTTCNLRISLRHGTCVLVQDLHGAGVTGVLSVFGLFDLGERVFHLDRPHIQTLKPSVAGHLNLVGLAITITIWARAGTGDWRVCRSPR